MRRRSCVGHGFLVARSPGPPLACSAMSEPARLAAMTIEMLAFNVALQVAIVSAISLLGSSGVNSQNILPRGGGPRRGPVPLALSPRSSPAVAKPGLPARRQKNQIRERGPFDTCVALGHRISLCICMSGSHTFLVELGRKKMLRCLVKTQRWQAPLRTSVDRTAPPRVWPRRCPAAYPVG